MTSSFDGCNTSSAAQRIICNLHIQGMLINQGWTGTTMIYETCMQEEIRQARALKI